MARPQSRENLLQYNDQAGTGDEEGPGRDEELGDATDDDDGKYSEDDEVYEMVTKMEDKWTHASTVRDDVYTAVLALMTLSHGKDKFSSPPPLLVVWTIL